MSLQQTSVMEEKQKFIRAWRSNQNTMPALCEAFGISSLLGYRIIKRFEEEGEKCFEDRSTRPPPYLQLTLAL